jgi:hypothetical protein
MKLNTASAVISFAKQLENESAKLYEDLSEKYVKDRDIFLSFVKENRKAIVQIERAYYGVISDAIEGCFAFDVETDEYVLEINPLKNAEHAASLAKAIDVERKIIRFYSDAAEQSKSLMADVPRAFLMVAKKREVRIQMLESLLKKDGAEHK